MVTLTPALANLLPGMTTPSAVLAMEWAAWLWTYDAAGWAMRLIMILVVMRKREHGAAMAWIVVVLFHPLVGAILYLLVGRVRVDPTLTGRYARLLHAASPSPPQSKLPIEGRFLDLIHLSRRLDSLVPTIGNHIALADEHERLVEGLVADIDAAKESVSLLYYIFWDDRTGRRITSALCAAQARGVHCRILADAQGSSPLFESHANELRADGIDVRAFLPVRPWQMLRARADLRNHRKLAVIDGAIAWTGSHNICDPGYGGSKYGPWIDLSVRIEGPAAREFARVFADDWFAQTGEGPALAAAASSAALPPASPPACPTESLPVSPPLPSVSGSAVIQVIRSGPVGATSALEPFLVGAMHEAEKRIIITAPYLVPTPPLLLELRVAVLRGVQVDLIVPRRSNHPIVHAAGRAFFQDLLDSGVRVHLHSPGLLHSKTMLVDDSFALVATANFDVRSLSLNFELNTLIFDTAAVAGLAAIHERYLSQSELVTPERWARRGRRRRFAEDFARLFSPLL